MTGKHLRISIAVIFVAAVASAATSSPSTSPALPEPIHVTLSLDHATPRQAFQKLFEQAHLPQPSVFDRDFDASASRQITVHWLNEPFLAAMMELCRQAAMTPEINTMNEAGFGFRSNLLVYQRSASSRAWRAWPFAPNLGMPTTAPRLPTSRALVTTTRSSAPPSWIDLPGIVRGPFLFIPRDIETRIWQRPGGRSGQFCDLVMMALIDPSVHPYAITTTLDVDAATDDQGRSLLDESAASHDELRQQPGLWMWAVSARLRHPAEDAHRIARLSGHLRVSLLTKVQTLEIDDLRTSATTQTSDAVRFRIDPLQGDQTQGFVVPLALFRDSFQKEQWEQLIIQMRDARVYRVEDQEKRRLPVSISTTWSQNSPTLEIKLHVRPPFENGRRQPTSRPSRLIWNVPTEVDDFAIPVEFKDLPLP